MRNYILAWIGRNHTQATSLVRALLFWNGIRPGTYFYCIVGSTEWKYAYQADGRIAELDCWQVG